MNLDCWLKGQRLSCSSPCGLDVDDFAAELGGTWGEEQRATGVTNLGKTVKKCVRLHFCSFPPWALRAALYLC